ncbi:Tyrosine kinase catalytic domain protein [Ceratobasidium sp. AG-Ba]|nr:Tyrosine kinase catalytic domain protein [Ceratobasidium sp. AG-Ba]
MLDAVQDMGGEPGLEPVISDINCALEHALQALKQWASISPYQAVLDEAKFIACIEGELQILGECNMHYVLGFEHQWSSSYARAKMRDESDLEEKLLQIAEEELEQDADGTNSRAQSPPPKTSPSTAMERLLAEGFKRSGMKRIQINNETAPDPLGLDIETLSREYNDSVQMTSQYQPPLLIPNDLSPVVAPLVQELASADPGYLGDPDDVSMHQVSHVPFVTISDINKMESATYLHNIRDLSLQIRLFGGHPMRRTGSIMTYLGSKVEDRFNPDTVEETTLSLQQLDNHSLVAVRLCSPHPSDQLLHSMIQRRLLQEACIWSRLTHRNIVPFLGMCRYLKLEKTPIVALVSPWHERTLSDYVKVFEDVDHIALATGVAQGLYYLHSNGLHHGGLHAGSVFVSEYGHAQIGNFSMCSKFELNPPLNLVIRLMGHGVLRCMAPEYIQGRVRSSTMMLNADVWSLAMVILQIFTHKTPFEGVPMPHGLVPFLYQGPTPAHPSMNELSDVLASRVPHKRKRTPGFSMPQSQAAALEAAAEAAAAVVPSKAEGHSAVGRGLTTDMWSLLQWCWKYDPRARPTMDEVVQRLKEISESSCIGLKNITTRVRKTKLIPVANGGQCDVFIGEFVAYPHEKVAMKKFRLYDNDDIDLERKKLIREVRLWSELKHPNILELYGLYDTGGTSIYMVSKWMSNGTAPEYLKKHPDANRKNIVSDALHGLCYLHELYILHGDLKGTNILIKDDGTACLADMGLSRTSHEPTTNSLRGSGSTQYMSPEILMTDEANGIQKVPIKTMESDIFAFGLVIREILGDERPYAEVQNPARVIRLIVDGYTLPRPNNPIAKQWLCDRMWEIVQAATNKDPTARPVAADLEKQFQSVPLKERCSPKRKTSSPGN